MKVKAYLEFKDFVRAVNNQAKKRRGSALRREEKEDLRERFKDDWREWDSGTVKLALQLLEISQYPQKATAINRISPWIAFQGDPDTKTIMREALGLSNPLSIDQINEFLNQFSVVGMDKQIALFYPSDLLRINGIKLWNIRKQLVAATKMFCLFKDIIDIQSRMYGFHPALILSNIICDIDIEPDEIVMFRNGDKITIEIESIDTSAQKIVQAYSQVRKLLKGKNRPTGLRKRSVELCVFMDRNLRLSSTDKLNRWNEEYPNWQYSNINAIQAAYSRIKPCWKDLKRFVSSHHNDDRPTA